MKKLHLDCFCSITKFKYHEQVKNDLLVLIDKSEYTSPVFEKAEVNISKCDWNISTNFSRPWFSYIKDYLFEHMLSVYKDLGYDGFTLQEIWYQQYLTGASHGWHTHSSNFTSVYYLELPKHEQLKTKIVSPYDQTTIIDLEVSEGDIVIFPSFVIHKAPINTTADRKTIISYNTNVTYSDAIYGQNLKER